MLKGIPAILSPELLKILMEMGHGDEIVIGDGNFPAQSMGQRVVRLDGHGVPGILDAVMMFFPLDYLVEKPVALMKAPDSAPKPVIWDRYEQILQSCGQFSGFDMMERSAFYDRARRAYAVVATGESAVFANIILRKGVVK